MSVIVTFTCENRLCTMMYIIYQAENNYGRKHKLHMIPAVCQPVSRVYKAVQRNEEGRCLSTEKITFSYDGSFLNVFYACE